MRHETAKAEEEEEISRERENTEIIPVKGKRTAARIMLAAFARRGVRTAFGIPGGFISPIFDAIADVPAIQLITTRHEGMAAFCALGHAIATGEPALVLTTSGPGITNAITGIAGANVESVPLIFIGGEVATHASSRGSIQDTSQNGIDSVAMLRTATRWSARIESSAMVRGAAERAYDLAKGPHAGAVFLSLPLDVGNAPSHSLLPLAPRHSRAPAPPDSGACTELATRLERAKRPLIIAGSGARGATKELFELAHRLSIPVVTTPHAKGIFPETDPLHLGIIGLGGHPSAVSYVMSNPDVVCIVGSRLGDLATDAWALPLCGSEATIQIDRDPMLIGRNYPVTLGIVADARAALRATLENVPKNLGRPVRTTGIQRHRPADALSDSAPVKPARVLSALQRAFPDAYWLADQGEHCAFALHYLQIEDPDRFRSLLGWASMGSGFGAAIGFKHARPDDRVICVCGDGGFLMHAGEIVTCVEQGIGIMLVVFNDGRLNMVHHGFQAVFGRRPEALPSHVADIAQVATALGAKGVRIDSPDQLSPKKLERLAEYRGPIVLDVRIDPNYALSADSRSASLRSAAFGGAR
ncbi:MAG: thiamine pyrophosphate-binding protein [Polyangiaceae bacterium]